MRIGREEEEGRVWKIDERGEERIDGKGREGKGREGKRKGRRGRDRWEGRKRRRRRRIGREEKSRE